MIKIYAHKIEHQSKNKHLFEIVITLWKTIKNKSCSLFPNQSNIKETNGGFFFKKIKGPKIKKKIISIQ
jgi:hypothetical protein